MTTKIFKVIVPFFVALLVFSVFVVASEREAFDNDCDSNVDWEDDGCIELADRDGDGFWRLEAEGGTDCDDDDLINPGIAENTEDLCTNEIDDDCDGDVDELDGNCIAAFDQDKDGYLTIGDDIDCNDGAKAINPGASEVCDGYDTDCDPDTSASLNGYGKSNSEEDSDGDGFLDCRDYCPKDTYPEGAIMASDGCAAGVDRGDGGWTTDIGSVGSFSGSLAAESYVYPVTGDATFDITGAAVTDITGRPIEDVPADPEVFIVNDATSPYGVRSLKVAQPEGDGVSQTIALREDTDYSISFYAKIGSEDGKMGFGFEIDGDIYAIKVESYSWKRYEMSFHTPEGFEEEVDFMWFSLDSPTIFYIDGLQLEEAPHPTDFYEYNYEYGCCEQSFCWTGGNCIDSGWYENYVLMPGLSGEIGEDGFRCHEDDNVADWEFSAVKPDPRHKIEGFCSEPDECFGNPNSGGSAGFPEDFLTNLKNALTEVDLQNLSNDKLAELKDAFSKYDVSSETWCRQPDEYYYFSDYRESYYCYEGNWTTRTKAIALQMLELVDDDTDYTLFCDKAENVLLEAEDGFTYRGFGFDELAYQDPHNALFSGMGEPLTDYFNEFCILRADDKVIIGTSLNHVNVTEKVDAGGNSYSFMEMIRGPVDGYDYCDNVQTDEDDHDGYFHACKNDDVWLNPQLNSVVWTMIRDNNKHSITGLGEPSFFEIVFEQLSTLLDNLLSIFGVAQTSIKQTELTFIENAGDFDKLYVSSFDDGERKIRGLKEVRYHEPMSEYKTIMSVEYENYYADVCAMLKENRQVESSLKQEDFFWSCNPVILLDEDDDPYWQYDVYFEDSFGVNDVWSGDIDVYAYGNANKFLREDPSNHMSKVYLWNDLTAKIRTRDIGEPKVIDKDVPEIEDTMNAAYMVNERVNINLEPDADISRIKAISWDFGDGGTHAVYVYGWNDLTNGTHVYSVPGTYEVKAHILYDDYTIETKKSGEFEVFPEVNIMMEETNDGAGTSTVTVEFSDPRQDDYEGDYVIYWDWGDGSVKNVSNPSGPEVSDEFVHTYADTAYNLIGEKNFVVNVSVYMGNELPFVASLNVNPFS